jgi:hypothetical protein
VVAEVVQPRAADVEGWVVQDFLMIVTQIFVKANELPEGTPLTDTNGRWLKYWQQINEWVLPGSDKDHVAWCQKHGAQTFTTAEVLVSVETARESRQVRRMVGRRSPPRGVAPV